VFDKFHMVRQFTAEVNKVSRQEVVEKDNAHKGVLGRTGYIRLKNPWNLTDRQKASLYFLETLNLKIHRYGFRAAKNYILNFCHCKGDLSLPASMHRFVRGYLFLKYYNWSSDRLNIAPV